MRTLRTNLKVIMTGTLLMGCAVGFAQGMPGGAGGQGGRITSGSRLQDRDRLSTHSMDRLHDRTHDRLHDRLHDQDRLRDRDRDQDRIYAANLMTAAERTRYEEQLHSLGTEQERVQFRMQHQQEMQQRAEHRGVRLRNPPSEAQVRTQEQQRQREREQIYGYSKMTPAEVGQYEQRIRSAHTEQERARISAEHRKLMEKREREQGEAAPQ